MDQAVVVGVGNIYAAESLFKAGISPLREAGKISRERYQRLADAVKEILGYAITRGGTTLRDFISPDGAPGYFEQELLVYGTRRAAVPELRARAEARHHRPARQRLVQPLPALSQRPAAAERAGRVSAAVNVCLPMMADLPPCA